MGGGFGEVLPAILVADRPRRVGRVAHGADDRPAGSDVRRAGDPCGATPLWRRSTGPAGYQRRSVGRARRLVCGNCGGVVLVGPPLAPSAIGAAQCDAAGARAGLRRGRTYGDVLAVSVRTRRRGNPAAGAADAGGAGRTPDARATRRDRRARACARPRPRQPPRGGAHGGRGDLLVPPARVVDRAADDRRTRASM